MDEKCREFIALKRKAQDLVRSENETRKSDIKDIMSRFREMRFLIYQHDMLETLSPSGLHSFISEIKSREILKALDFIPAVNEPQNITVGSIHYDYVIDNKKALDFLTENYDFLLDENDTEKICLPYTIAMNENLALCYRDGKGVKKDYVSAVIAYAEAMRWNETKSQAVARLIELCHLES